MQQDQQKQLTSLPENAYRELAEGEKYEPMMSSTSTPAEVTPYSVSMGILMAVLFSAAAAYLGLKIGQVFEAAFFAITDIAASYNTYLNRFLPL